MSAAGSSAEVSIPAQEDMASRAAQRERQATAEHRQRLYGTRASEVRVMEAMLNRTFDRELRENNPPFWPSVPLRNPNAHRFQTDA
jgi:hypothetical protein